MLDFATKYTSHINLILLCNNLLEIDYSRRNATYYFIFKHKYTYFKYEFPNSSTNLPGWT